LFDPNTLQIKAKLNHTFNSCILDILEYKHYFIISTRDKTIYLFNNQDYSLLDSTKIDSYSYTLCRIDHTHFICGTYDPYYFYIFDFVTNNKLTLKLKIQLPNSDNI